METPREILFKAKRKDNGEWVYGYPMPYRCGDDKGYEIVINEMCYDKVFDRLHSYCAHIIEPTTLSQFTGKYDTSGKRIFENDIVEIEQFNNYDNYYDFTTLVGYVHWCGGAFEVLGKETEDDEPYVWLHDCIQAGIQVIGNRFDNPELLEEENL